MITRCIRDACEEPWVGEELQVGLAEGASGHRGRSGATRPVGLRLANPTYRSDLWTGHSPASGGPTLPSPTRRTSVSKTWSGVTLAMLTSGPNALMRKFRSW